MEIMEESRLLEAFFGIALVVFLFYKYWTRNYDYWKIRGVPQVEEPFRRASGEDQFRKSLRDMYNRFKGKRYFGLIRQTEPNLCLIDLDLIKQIMTKDFQHFTDRKFFPDLPHDFIQKNMFNLEGEVWKRMRTKLSPTFTSGKMKLIFNLMEEVANVLKENVVPLAESESIIDAKDLMARFTTDVIGTCAFGLETNSLHSGDNEFRKIGKLIFDTTFRTMFTVLVVPHIPWIAKIFPITFTDPRITKFEVNLLKATLEYREKNNVVRNDFIDLMRKVNKKMENVDDEVEITETHDIRSRTGHDYGELTIQEMAAQLHVFFAAGFETGSSTSAFLLYELAVHKHVQDKLRQEIDTVLTKHGGKLTYNTVHEMRYLDQCINETLRRYGTLPFLQRVCTKRYKVPESDLIIEEGVKVIISTYSIHHDPAYYPEPYKFDPERFSEEAISSRHQYTFLPFGEGPRICIAKRLGMMQVQMAIITMLKDFELSLTPDLPSVLPMNPNNFFTSSLVPIKLVVSKRKTA